MIALAGVVLTHVIAWAGRDTAEADVWGRTIELLARSGVPCFLVLNGILLGMNRGTRQQPMEYLRRRWLRVGAPWLAWSAVWLVGLLWISDGIKGLAAPEPGDVLAALSFGPGYLYFLLLVVQFTALGAFWPAERGRRIMLAVLLAGAQLAINQARLFAPVDALGTLLEGIDLRAYELAPYWVGTFAVGVAIGGCLPRRPSPRLTLAVLFLCGLSGLGLVYAPELGWWNTDRLDGARSLLHPLYLPFAVTEVLLLYWGATAVAGHWGALAAAAPALGEASFGVYLVQQYPLELIGPLFQTADAPWRVSDSLPEALPAVLCLYAFTLSISFVATCALRRTAFGRLISGGSTRRSA